MGNRICSIDGCERKHQARGLCSRHYQRLAKDGLEPLKPKGCKVEGCDAKHEGLGYCKSHHRMFKKHGDPLVKGVSSGRFTAERTAAIWADPAYRAMMSERNSGANSATYKGAKQTLMCVTCWAVFDAYPNYDGTERLYCSRKCAYECPDRSAKLRKANTGKKASPETIQKLRDSHIGKMCGPDSPSWKGGISALHQGLRSHPAYARWRTAVFKRDDYTCQLCGVRGGKLRADHHPYPFAKYPDKRLDVENGRTLCQPCDYHVTYVTKEWRMAPGPEEVA